MVRQIDQDRVNDLAMAVEPCAIAAWPARDTLEIGGWLLRFSDGYSHRGNSVAARDFHGADLQTQIAVAEIAYFSRGLTPLFQITPLSKPANLEAVLIDRGYVSEAPTHVMVADVSAIKPASSRDVVLSGEPSARFKALVLSGSHSYADGCERLDVLSRISNPHVFATIGGNGEAASCGMCVVMDGWAGINLMRTAPAHRRKGLATEILASLAHWAKKQDATRLYLQVEDNNPSARALYRKAGFIDAYLYRFYRAP